VTTAALPGVRAELAAAVRAVNARFARLPAEVQTRVDVAATDSLEAEVDAAILAGDRERAERAIAAWRDHWLATFEAAR
jgi:hypothetical protein